MDGARPGALDLMTLNFLIGLSQVNSKLKSPAVFRLRKAARRTNFWKAARLSAKFYSFLNHGKKEIIKNSASGTITDL